jgi:nicotinamidase-related amidase
MRTTLNCLATEMARNLVIRLGIAGTVTAAILAYGYFNAAHAQTAKRSSASTQLASSQPKLLDPSDAVILLLDHQAGLFQTVKDITVQELRTNTTVLAKLGALAKIPVITTASEPGGPNGPLMPELNQAAPNATYIPRKGEVSAWENADFVKAVKATGKKTLIMAGVWTSVCVAFPAIQAKAEGYTVYAVIDASGDMSQMASQVAVARMAQAGVIPVSTNVVVTEVQRTWNRPDALQYGALYAEFAPHYRAVIESYDKAQEVARQSRH